MTGQTKNRVEASAQAVEKLSDEEGIKQVLGLTDIPAGFFDLKIFYDKDGISEEEILEEIEDIQEMYPEVLDVEIEEFSKMQRDSESIYVKVSRDQD